MRKFRASIAEMIVIALMIAIVIAVFVSVGYQYNSCQDVGGEFVRGIFWFKCI